MADVSVSPSSSAPPRPKTQRSSTNVRGRSSPTPGSNNDTPTDGRPPTKRARKAINCEPCRNSKLKCDRNRPCSSCVLRGTSAMCYQDARGPDGNDSYSRGDDFHYTRIDPAQEIGRLRHSVSLLEAYIFPHHRNNPALHKRSNDVSAHVTPKKEVVEVNGIDKNQAAPYILGHQVLGGLYAGPTSAATHLITSESRLDEVEARRSQDQDDFPATYDNDLLAMFPPLEIADGLIRYYFECCNWIYRHVNENTFRQQWERFKNGSSGDRLVLSTAFVVMAVAAYYLPIQHPLLETFSMQSHEEVSQKFYELSSVALQRRLAESKTYTLELVELLLVRCHYLTLSKRDSEEIWYTKGELISIATAIGLHRDPGKWNMPREVAERRRWTWWHIILLERWQAFLFGRPISIASHHYDTQLPSYCDPAVDKTGRFFLPNIALLRLAGILGDIMDDAVSVRPVPYENIQAHDRALTQWLENLPSELDLDDFRIARSLASPNLNAQRLGVQSVIIRTSYHHIRFTLHRPYASLAASANPSTGNSKNPSPDSSKFALSLEIAVSAAEKLIAMVGHIRPDHLAKTSLAVPAHMNWAPFHAFSAAMFFSFQLIANPDQPGASLFRDSIRKANATLENYRGNPVADKALIILQALTPLYSSEFLQENKEEQGKLRAQILRTVRKLAFPYHDSHNSDSPGRSASSPSSGAASSPPTSTLANLSTPYDPLNVHSAANIYSQNGLILSSPQTQAQMSPTVSHSQGLTTLYSQSYPMSPQQSLHTDASRYQYANYVDDTAMWGAAVGFNQGEWCQFLDGLRTEPMPPSRPPQAA
ncbi:Fungal specific transcription factor domain containing protein [Amanita muscaria]